MTMFTPQMERLADISSTDRNALDEYMSRPYEGYEKDDFPTKADQIVVYGAQGKFMRHTTFMLLRGLATTGSTPTVHLVDYKFNDPRFSEQLAELGGNVKLHELDLTQASESDLQDIPQAAIVYYGVGMKFKDERESDEAYRARLKPYGDAIPRLLIGHHLRGADIVVMGSANGLGNTTWHSAATEAADLNPAPDNYYGHSILQKERVIHELLDGAKDGSRAVILRGGWYTDLTYGGFEDEIMAMREGRPIDLSQKAYFNLMSHRDAALFMITAHRLADVDPAETYNFAGPLVNIQQAAVFAADCLAEMGQEVDLKFIGAPANRHLLMDGSKLEAELEMSPMDSVADIVRAQTFWVANGGFSMGLDHHVGRQMDGVGAGKGQ